MKLFTGWVMSAGLVLATATANAQAGAPQQIDRLPIMAVSDFGGPYAAMPPEAPASGYGPTLLPPREVYTVVRESGFSALGIPRQRGMFYVIAVVDRRGDNGRLVIDARDGQVVRFVPAYRTGANFNEDMTTAYGPGGPPPIGNLNGAPRPPASVPKVASRMPATVPMPKAPPPRPGEAKPLAEKSVPAPAQRSAAVQTRPADAPATPQAAPPVAEAKSAPEIQPTQPMPQVQGLE